MANKKISALTSGNPAQNGDLIPIDRSGANFKVTAQSLAALAGGSVPAGLNVFNLPGDSPSGGGGFTPASTAFVGGGTAFLYFTGRGLNQPATQARITLNVTGASIVIAAINIAKVAQGTGTWSVVSPVNISFGSNFAPTLATGVHTSDTFAMTFDTTHDYVIRLYSVGGGVLSFLQSGNGNTMPGGSYFNVSGDQTGADPVVLTGGNTYGNESWITNFLSA